jgi:hypothetical protein
MVRGTPYEARMTGYKRQRKIVSKRLVGKRWYKGLIKRYGSLLKRACCYNKDGKRHTLCTSENFHNMYESVYSEMVEASVAIKLDDEIILDIDGNQVFDEEQMYGRITKYLITKPENVLLVDKTGCNTDQKEDGHVGVVNTFYQSVLLMVVESEQQRIFTSQYYASQLQRMSLSCVQLFSSQTRTLRTYLLVGIGASTFEKI